MYTVVFAVLPSSYTYRGDLTQARNSATKTREASKLVGYYNNNRLGIIDYCALPASRRRVGNESLEPRPAAEAVMNNNQLIRDGN